MVSPGPVLPQALAEAAELTSGARWVRVALQVNPFAYVGANAPSNSFTDEASYNAALMSELQELGIELIAVTDHWRAESAQSLIAACEAAGVHALPGLEAISGEGIHVLVIFDGGTSTNDVNAAIGACGVTPGCQSGTIGKPFAEIVSADPNRDRFALSRLLVNGRNEGPADFGRTEFETFVPRDESRPWEASSRLRHSCA
jgi:hypothetical protein